MNELIKTTAAVINNETVNAVNARELWEKLESRKQFADWIKNRLADFSEGQDFLISPNCEIKGRGGDRKSVEYILTLDTAKHICMMERNETGKKIRQYFIEVEKRFRNIGSIADTVISALTPVIRENERLKAQYDFARHFLPNGNPGELNENGEAKNRYRRGYYCAGNGRSITALIARTDTPDLFEAFELTSVTEFAKA